MRGARESKNRVDGFKSIWLVAAIAPADRAAWLLENIVLLAAVCWVIVTQRKWPLSRASYVLLFIFFVLHVVGAHYTYASTPLGDWLQDALNAVRNPYDRLVHFLFGLLMTFPIKDQLRQAARLSERFALWMAFLLIVAISTVYELLEWITAEIVTSDNAYAFLGTQGDPFDSQKDTALALAGALLAIAIITLLKSRGTR
jgi:putative membrane protein